MKKTNANNKTRKIAAMIAAMALTATMAVPGMMMSASAANTITITNTDQATHTYKAYKIFAGTLGSDGATLVNITWGGGVNGTSLLAALKGDVTLSTYFTSCTNAADVADVLATKNFIDDGELTQAFADIVANNLGTAETASFTNSGATSSITGIADGYYLIQDDENPTNTTAGADNKGARTRFILKVAGEDVTVTAKHSAPSVMKKVQEDSIAETAQTVSFAGNASYAAGNGYNDVADYNIGEAVPFKLYGSMPATLADYSAYYYEFSDTLASQFDQPTTVTVNVGTTTLTYTWNSTSSKYDVDATHQLAAVATGSAAVTATEYYFNGDSTFRAQVEAAFESDTTYRAYTTESEKAQHVYTNWTTFTTAQTAYTAADKDIYIKTKTVVTTPAIVVHEADTTTDGNCRVTWTAGASAGDPGTLSVTFEDIKAYGVTTTSVVTVEYNATLNNTAVIGLDGQQNAVKLVYSSNPNVNYTPDTNDTTDQGATHKSGGNTNDTPDDKVIVFTYELDVNKINSDGSLKGAQFVVYRKNSSNVNEYAKVAANGSGAYRLSEWTTTIPTTKTPADTTNGFTDEEIATASTDGVFISSGDASKPIVIAGLDDGEYYLMEIATPDSTYNAISDIKLTIASTHKGDTSSATAGAVQDWDTFTLANALQTLTLVSDTPSVATVVKGKAEDTTTQDLANGIVSANVLNTKGSQLPSTGGMGTTLFILGGGVTAAAAGIYLVSKKRAKEGDAQ